MQVQTFTKRSPEEIVYSLLQAADSNVTIYGGIIRDLFDPSKQGKTGTSDIDVFIGKWGYKQFLEAVINAGFIRECTEKKAGPAHLGGAYSHSRIEQSFNVVLEVEKRLFSLDLNVGSHDVCDFTCNNLCFESGRNIRTRCEDVFTKTKGLMWMSRCIQDIVNHRLVPMCPLSVMRIDERSGPSQRRQHINLVRRAMIRMAQGYTLEPHLDGSRLIFEVYKGFNQCPCCLDTMLEDLAAVMLLCGHPVHINCLLSIVHTDGPPSTRCPLCRSPLLLADSQGNTFSEKKVPPKETVKESECKKVEDKSEGWENVRSSRRGRSRGRV